MKTLSQLIFEQAIDYDNLIFKIDMYFKEAVNDKQIAFKNFVYDLCKTYREKHIVNYDLTVFPENDIINFCDFVCDNVKLQIDEPTVIDYKFTFKKIIELASQYLINPDVDNNPTNLPQV